MVKFDGYKLMYTCWLFMYITKINDVFFSWNKSYLDQWLVKRGKAWLPERTTMTGDDFFYPTHENGDFGFIGFTTLWFC